MIFSGSIIYLLEIVTKLKKMLQIKSKRMGRVKVKNNLKLKKQLLQIKMIMLRE